MKIEKIETKLGIKPMETDEVELTEDLTILEESAIIPYTENPELQKDVDCYKDERGKNIKVLIDARENIKKIFDSVTSSVKVGGDAKDIDSYAKLLNTLTNVVGKLDEISNPQKVELYIEPKVKDSPVDDGPVNNTQNNIFLGSPSDLIKLMKQAKTEEEEKDGEVQ